MIQFFSRREFIKITAVIPGVLILKDADAQSTVNESDPQAAALGYRNLASNVDSRFKKYTSGQNCSNCALFSNASNGLGRCPLFANKFVSASGWCSAYAARSGVSTPPPVNTQNDEVKKLQAEVSRLQELEKAKQEPIQAEAVIKNAPPENERLSLDASKKKCTELGFKPATEVHGKCVLQLSK
jgi:hypothetical protein